MTRDPEWLERVVEEAQRAVMAKPRHLKGASEIVATWPEWKRNILGRPRGED